MRKIKWEYDSATKGRFAIIGPIHMFCFPSWSSTLLEKPRSQWLWITRVYLGRKNMDERYGEKHRRSLSKSKEDAIQLARELLDDYKVGIEEAKKQFERKMG